MIQINWKSKWHDSLIWCPSQLTREFEWKGKVYTLYCRWRHQNPWSFSIYEKVPTTTVMHGKIYDAYNYENWVNIGWGMTEEDDIDDVHKYAEELLEKFLTTTEFP